MSLREIIEGERFWPLDPVRPPPGSSLRGHGFPYGRDESKRCDYEEENCLGTWSGDATYLPDSVNRELIREHSYDFGHAHREDKGVFESIRCSPLQAPGGDVSYEGYGDRGQSVSELLHRHRNATVQDVLLFNCRLTHVGSGLDFAPEEFHKRKKEIGRMLKKEGFDVAALCELFKARTGSPSPELRAQADVADRIRGPGQEAEDGRITSQDSGLELLCLENETGVTPSIVDNRQGTFDLKKPDNKGWLYTVLDVGAGEIDLFLTHTAGNLGEIRELAEAVENHGKPQNPTVLVGDLNIADFKPAYNDMVRILGEVGLQDAWLTRGGVEGTTELARTEAPVEDLWACKDYESSVHGGPACSCNDYPVAEDPGTTRGTRYELKDRVDIDFPFNEYDFVEGKRIDYVFVGRPRDRHAVNLDVSRIHRRAFPRLGPCGYGTWDGDNAPDMRYLSDHMGLGFRLLVSEKRFRPPTEGLSWSLSNVRLSRTQGTNGLSSLPVVNIEATVDWEYTGPKPLPAVRLKPVLTGYRFDKGALPVTSWGETVQLNWDYRSEFGWLRARNTQVSDLGTIQPGQRGQNSMRIELAGPSAVRVMIASEDLADQMYDGFQGLDVDIQATSIRGATSDETHTRSAEQVQLQ